MLSLNSFVSKCEQTYSLPRNDRQTATVLGVVLAQHLGGRLDKVWDGASELAKVWWALRWEMGCALELQNKQVSHTQHVVFSHTRLRGILPEAVHLAGRLVRRRVECWRW